MKSNKLKITLIGKLPKGDGLRKDFVDWKADYEKRIHAVIPSAVFIHGDLVRDTIGSIGVVGNDLWGIKRADIVIVHADGKVGAGTAQEMVIAKKFKKPVISVIPKDSHHRRSNLVFDGAVVKDWIHPFLDVSSDIVVEDVEQAIKWIKSYLAGKKKIKSISTFDEAIAIFEKKHAGLIKEYKKRGW